MSDFEIIVFILSICGVIMLFMFTAHLLGEVSSKEQKDDTVEQAWETEIIDVDKHFDREVLDKRRIDDN